MTEKINSQNPAGVSSKVLIPVDFSDGCELSLRLGFEIARRLDLHVTLLHASMIPNTGLLPQFPDDFTGMDNEENQLEEAELGSIIHEADQKRMNGLLKKIKDRQADGQLPMVEFNSYLSEGMPEEVIREYCEQNSPRVVVMATRSREKREEELIGSVTAEVIDNVRVPIFTVPENYSYVRVEDVVRICAFCHLDGNDYDSISSLMGMFENPALKIWLFPLPHKIDPQEADQKTIELKMQLESEFKNSDFYVVKTPEKGIKNIIDNLFRENDIQMILSPNRKRNFFVRLFRPGLAHRLLFEKDIPMLVMPV